VYYVRPTGRCPGKDFLQEDCQQGFRKKFVDGQFQTIVHQLGAKYVNDYRFAPLHGDGKPLWEFKHKDHRLYCLRMVSADDKVEIVLFNGWIKDKKAKRGQSREEGERISTAKMLLGEFWAEPKG
jgi:hypothetical protein